MKKATGLKVKTQVKAGVKGGGTSGGTTCGACNNGVRWCQSANGIMYQQPCDL